MARTTAITTTVMKAPRGITLLGFGGTPGVETTTGDDALYPDIVTFRLPKDRKHHRMKRKERIHLIVLCVILSIIVIVLLMVRPSRSKPIPLRDTFRITLSEDTGGTLAYVVNGSTNRHLQLKRGYKYHFDIQTPNHPIYFSSTKDGGGKDGFISGSGDEGLASVGDFDVVIDRKTDKGTFYFCSMSPSGPECGSIEIV